MPAYITCEADPDFPVPNAGRVADQLRALFDGERPVTALAVAKAIGADLRAVEAVLRRGEHAGLVRHIQGRGWVPGNDRD